MSIGLSLLKIIKANRALGILGFVLITGSILAALPGSPADPIDARTNLAIDGVRVEFDYKCAFIEPLLAPGLMIADAPDMRAAAMSFIVWLGLIVGLVFGYKSWRRKHKILPALSRGALMSFVSVLMFMVYLSAFLLLRLPDRRLVTDIPDTSIADLQSHTFGSHDGMVDARGNVNWHINSGCDIAAVTEHNHIEGALITQHHAALTRGLEFAVLSGVEYKLKTGGFLLAIMSQQIKKSELMAFNPRLTKELDRPTLPVPPYELSEVTKWIDEIHAQDGVVIALYWKLDVDDIHTLARLGVDGFELANAGHPEISAPVRNAILSEAKKRGLALVASSDWHGWGGVARTWTLFTLPGLDDLSHARRAERIVLMLRTRFGPGITPVTSGEIRVAMLVETIFAPLTELLRYAMSLDFLRTLGWWIWIAIILLLSRWLTKFGLASRVVLGFSYFLIVSFAATLGGVWILGMCQSGLGNQYAFSLGIQGAVFGLIGTVVAVIILWREVSHASKCNKQKLINKEA